MPEPITQVLARIHAELDEIARRIDRNQAAIARSTWRAGAGDASYVTAMQDADLNAQRIAGVAGFLRALGDAADPRWRVDTAAAAAGLRLAALERAIGRDVPAGEDGAAGDVDLF
jgi:hypothetical protein